MDDEGKRSRSIRLEPGKGRRGEERWVDGGGNPEKEEGREEERVRERGRGREREKEEGKIKSKFPDRSGPAGGKEDYKDGIDWNWVVYYGMVDTVPYYTILYQTNYWLTG